jgi:hypothetical protein
VIELPLAYKKKDEVEAADGGAICLKSSLRRQPMPRFDLRV